jgi:prepilin-type N-terminal cleavage/methylation domain-containing protein/prepilin-type processing-associated H-X9-DG protein
MKLNECTKRAAGGGFTLVELLVVIGVIAILAGLMLPAIARAKDKAKSITCVANLKQMAVGLRTFAEENEGKLPTAEQLPSAPVDPEKPLPRICDLLASQFGYNTNAMPQVKSVFRCPSDVVKRFEENGSSYEWNSIYNGRPVENPRRSSNPVSEAPLMYDYENFHPGALVGSKNILFADGHVGKI